MNDLCRSCRAKIVWAETLKGKRIPLDAKPSEQGNIMLHERGTHRPPLALIVSKEQREGTQLRLFTSHFVTCPHADKWRHK